MKLLTGYLMLAMALVISSVAAYFSVIGLAALFAATATAVIVMGVSLEAGKLATASWVHSNWRNPKVNLLLRGYLVAAVFALMLITSLGIYGFLAKGHLEQSTPLAPVELEIATKQGEIDAAKANIESQQVRLGQLDAAVNSMIGGDKAERGLRYRRTQTAERQEIQRSIQADTAKIQAISKELIPLKLQVNEVETKLGPVKYVAELFGLEDSEAAVRIVIMIIMFAFDPLAVVMVLAAFISISDGLEERRRAREGVQFDITPPEEPEPEPEFLEGEGLGEILTLEEGQKRLDAYAEWSQTPEAQALFEEALAQEPEAIEEEEPGSLLVELEEAVKPTDKEVLLDILERKPELLQEIVEAVKETPETPLQDGMNDSWLDSGPPK